MIAARIARELHLDEAYVRLVAKTASHRYKTYQIAKKGGGYRTIHHPARELKLLQAWLAENVLAKLPVHPAASAYKTGSSVKKHASVHRHNNFLLKVDFRNFFPSITKSDITRMLKKNFRKKNSPLAGPRDFEMVTRLVCKGDSLTIGAPSSPALSNAVMYEFDSEWAPKCHRMGVAYTRYADDIYFSTNRPKILATVLSDLRSDLKNRKSPKLQINNEKTAFTSRKRRRLVTGVVITPDGNLSLGRTKKRYIKSLIFRHTGGRLSLEERNYLRGYISFARSVEPEFITRLARKYGAEAIKSATSDDRTGPNLPT